MFSYDNQTTSLVKYYLKSINAIDLLKDVEILPKEYACVFRAQEQNGVTICRLSDTLRRNVNLLPAWSTEAQFDDWDDW